MTRVIIGVDPHKLSAPDERGKTQGSDRESGAVAGERTLPFPGQRRTTARDRDGPFGSSTSARFTGQRTPSTSTSGCSPCQRLDP